MCVEPIITHDQTLTQSYLPLNVRDLSDKMQRDIEHAIGGEAYLQPADLQTH